MIAIHWIQGQSTTNSVGPKQSPNPLFGSHVSLSNTSSRVPRSWRYHRVCRVRPTRLRAVARGQRHVSVLPRRVGDRYQLDSVAGLLGHAIRRPFWTSPAPCAEESIVVPAHVLGVKGSGGMRG